MFIIFRFVLVKYKRAKLYETTMIESYRMASMNKFLEYFATSAHIGKHPQSHMKKKNFPSPATFVDSQAWTTLKMIAEGIQIA